MVAFIPIRRDTEVPAIWTSALNRRTTWTARSEAVRRRFIFATMSPSPERHRLWVAPETCVRCAGALLRAGIKRAVAERLLRGVLLVVPCESSCDLRINTTHQYSTYSAAIFARFTGGHRDLVTVHQAR